MRHITAIASLSFALLALHVDQTQRITERLADGTLAVRVREIHTEHRMPVQPNEFDEKSYTGNMRELQKLSLQAKCQAGERQYCPGSRKK